jgi:lysosomal acid lipase/cholesteryl ester hydrolase
LLADAGYDVWVGNNRGNGYSMVNKHFTPSQAGFWNFTWDSFAEIDLPTEINYVLKATGQKKLTYAGISQGTTQAFAGFSGDHALASKVDLFIAFAPVAYVHHQRSELMKVLADLDLGTLLELLGDREFTMASAVRKLLPGVCDLDPTACEYAISLEVGPSVHMNSSRLGFYIEYEMAPTSVWNMIHWSQGVRKEVFEHMNWGAQANQWRYHQPTPPSYHLSNLPTSLPIALFTGGEDYLADAVDVATILKQMPGKPVHVDFQPTYSHIDYVISTDAHTTIYPEVFKLLEKYSGNREGV